MIKDYIIFIQLIIILFLSIALTTPEVIETGVSTNDFLTLNGDFIVYNYEEGFLVYETKE